MFKSGHVADGAAGVRASKDSKGSIANSSPNSSPEQKKQKIEPPSPTKPKDKEIDGPTESPMTPDTSFVQIKQDIEKEQEIQRNLDLELVKLQASAVNEEDDELTKTSKEKEKAQRINNILRKKSESQARVAGAQAQQNAKLEQRLQVSETKLKNANSKQGSGLLLSPVRIQEESKTPYGGKVADTPADGLEAEIPQDDNNNELQISVENEL